MSYGLIRETYNKTIGAVEEVLFELAVNNVEDIGIEVNVTGDPLTSFTISVRFHSGGSFNDYYVTAADYTSPACPLKVTSGDMTTLSGKGFAQLDTESWDAVRIKATSSGSSTLSIFVGG